MPVETAQFISDLNANLPGTTDPTSQGDDHIRLIKNILKNTFPNVTGVVTASNADLNAAADVADSGAKKLSDDGAFFNTNDTDGITNPAAGEVDVEAGGETVVKFKSDKSATFQGDISAAGAITATGPITGPGAIPIGMPIPWLSDDLPDTSWGVYAWCNGAEYPRSNTALFNVIGTKFGAGNGTTTANLPDWREVVPIGKSTMGGSTAKGLISQYADDLKTVGKVIGEARHTLTAEESAILSYTSTVHDPGHTHNVPNNWQKQTPGSGDVEIGGGISSPSTIVINPATTGITVTTTSNAGGGSHNNTQLSFVCNWIIRIG